MLCSFNYEERKKKKNVVLYIVIYLLVSMSYWNLQEHQRIIISVLVMHSTLLMFLFLFFVFLCFVFCLIFSVHFFFGFF